MEPDQNEQRPAERPIIANPSLKNVPPLVKREPRDMPRKGTPEYDHSVVVYFLRSMFASEFARAETEWRDGFTPEERADAERAEREEREALGGRRELTPVERDARIVS